MGNFFQSFLRALFLILKSLRPVLIIILILFTLFAGLFIYDRLKTNEERRLGAELSKNLDVKSACNTSLIGQNEKFDFTFVFTNNNPQPVFVHRVGIDLDLLGRNDKKYSSLLSTVPDSNPIEPEHKFYFYEFATAVEIPQQSKTEIILKLQTTARKEAKANPNTIVIYDGEVTFLLSPEMTNTENCKIQVRYPS